MNLGQQEQQPSSRGSPARTPASGQGAPAARPPAYSTFSLIACLVGTLGLRTAASLTGATVQLYFGYIDQHVYPLSDTARGLALAVFFLPELLGSPLLGAWSDRLGRKWFMVFGALFGGVGVQLTAMTTDYGALAAMRLLGGLSSASAIPATLSFLSAMTAHSESLRGRVMGLFQLATLGGTLLGLLAGGRLWDSFHQGAFTIDAILYLVAVALFALGIREARTSSGRERAPANTISSSWQTVRQTVRYYRTVLGSPTILGFAPAFLAINMVLGTWTNHVIGQLVATGNEFPHQLLYGVLAHNRHAGSEISLYGALVLGLFGAGALVWSFVLSRFRRTSIMLLNTAALFALCLCVYALNHAASLSAPVVPIYLALAAGALVILSGMMPAALTYLADVSEERTADRGAIMGVYTIFFGLGGFFGTLLGGPFADWNGIDGILLFTALLGILATVMLIRLHQTESPQTQAILSKE